MIRRPSHRIPSRSLPRRLSRDVRPGLAPLPGPAALTPVGASAQVTGEAPATPEMPAETLELLRAGRLEQTCPDCGRIEAAHWYCSGCFRPMSPTDWRVQTKNTHHSAKGETAFALCLRCGRHEIAGSYCTYCRTAEYDLVIHDHGFSASCPLGSAERLKLPQGGRMLHHPRAAGYRPESDPPVPSGFRSAGGIGPQNRRSEPEHVSLPTPPEQLTLSANPL